MSEGGAIGNDIRWNESGTPNLERAIEVTGETAEILAKKAAIVIRLFYEELAQEAKANSLANLKQNSESPNLEGREMSGETADILAKKAALVIRLFYEEERQKAEERRASTLVQNSDSPSLDEPIKSERTDLNNNIPENFQEGSMGKETANVFRGKRRK